MLSGVNWITAEHFTSQYSFPISSVLMTLFYLHTYLLKIIFFLVQYKIMEQQPKHTLMITHTIKTFYTSYRGTFICIFTTACQLSVSRQSV
jgi:hypothetical protein